MKHYLYTVLVLTIISIILQYVVTYHYIVTWIAFGVTLLIAVLGLIIIAGTGIYKAAIVLLGHESDVIPFLKKTIGVTIVSLVAMLAQMRISELYKHTPDNAMLAEITAVDINNTTQYLTIRGEDESNPVILFLAGGPGGSQIQETRTFLTDLEDEYTIVNWEQPGSGMSYNAYRTEDITIDTYVRDGHEVTKYLQNRFNQDTIYLMGESWGSYLAIEMAIQYPEDYKAIINAGQMVDFVETEEFCYNKAMEIAKERGDQGTVEALQKLGVPPYYGDGIATDMATYLIYLHGYMAGDERIAQPNFDTFHQLFSYEYSIMDSINVLRALVNTFGQVYPQLYDTDLRETHTDLDIPLYILHGRHDINAPLYLAEDYFELVNAPDKELIVFNHSGHNPWMNEPRRFTAIVKRIISDLEE